MSNIGKKTITTAPNQTKEINSFSTTVAELVHNTNNVLESLTGMNEAMTTENDSVTLETTKINPYYGNTEKVEYKIPSFNSVISKVNNFERILNNFIDGNGYVFYNDGKSNINIQIKANPIPQSPANITFSNLDVSAYPFNFSTKNNWFFEDLMFPQLCFTLDLTKKVDKSTERVKVRRIIIDNPTETDTLWFKNQFFVNNLPIVNLSYKDVIDTLNINEKQYWIDDEIKEFPLNKNKYSGQFQVLEKININDEIWYVLDTLEYGLTNDIEVVKNIQLNVKDTLRYKNTIFQIEDIVVDEKRIKLNPISGLDNVSVYNKEIPQANYYLYPYDINYIDKNIQIPVSLNECQIVFFKSINKYNNIEAESWSSGIPFYSNDLTLANSNTTLPSYYNAYVSDFGIQMAGMAKEKFIPAYLGSTPNTPVLNETDYKVVQINTQLNASLKTDDIKNTQIQIEQLKSAIDSNRQAISMQKSQMLSITDVDKRATLQKKIDDNLTKLNNDIAQYNSLVKYLINYSKENGSVLTSPKFRVRGFFDIPQPIVNPTTGKEEEIIQFEVLYRYKTLEDTGVELNTFPTLLDSSTGNTVNGVFTDWISSYSNVKQRKYNAQKGIYEWVSENIANGDVININQIDIPITKGEKVEFKVRAISEAGYPMNPLKSEWSNVITMSFPANLNTSNQISSILTDAQEEEMDIKISDAFATKGVDAHLADSIPNPNAIEGTLFKHQAKYLACTIPTLDASGATLSESTYDLQSVILEILKDIKTIKQQIGIN